MSEIDTGQINDPLLLSSLHCKMIDLFNVCDIESQKSSSQKSPDDILDFTYEL